MKQPFTVIRSARRTLALEITGDGSLLVRGPYWLTDKMAKEFIEKNQPWIDAHLPRVQEKYRRMQALTNEDIIALKSRAQEVLPARVEYFSRLMKLTPSSVKITAAKKRFGSCSGKNSLCFSCFLILYPPEAIDYVVVHELAHIRFHDHSPAFHALVEEYLPDAKARRRLLKEFGI